MTGLKPLDRGYYVTLIRIRIAVNRTLRKISELRQQSNQARYAGI